MNGLVTPELLDAIASVESANNPRAINKKSGARGMYQFMPIAWKDVQQNYKNLAKYNYDKDVFDPKISRQYAQALLELNAKRLGDTADLPSLLASYNYGIGNVKKKGMMNLPKETQDYIKKVYQQLNRR